MAISLQVVHEIAVESRNGHQPEPTVAETPSSGDDDNRKSKHSGGLLGFFKKSSKNGSKNGSGSGSLDDVGGGVLVDGGVEADVDRKSNSLKDRNRKSKDGDDEGAGGAGGGFHIRLGGKLGGSKEKNNGSSGELSASSQTASPGGTSSKQNSSKTNIRIFEIMAESAGSGANQSQQPLAVSVDSGKPAAVSAAASGSPSSPVQTAVLCPVGPPSPASAAAPAAVVQPTVVAGQPIQAAATAVAQRPAVTPPPQPASPYIVAVAIDFGS